MNPGQLERHPDGSIKIPKGWRELDPSEIRKEGDYFCGLPDWHQWEPVKTSIGAIVGATVVIRFVTAKHLRWGVDDQDNRDKPSTVKDHW